jgi:hypothetical protein
LGAYSLCLTARENSLTELQSNDFDYQLMAENALEARELIDELYSEYTPVSSNKKLGFQASLLETKGTESEQTQPLTKYGRVWAYDAAIALSLAAAEKCPTADPRWLWFKENAQYVPDPRDPSKEMFAGWAFSANQAKLGDNYKDPRYVTGANSWALIGIAEYIVSHEMGSELESFFSKALDGLLFHMQVDGPNQGLVTAGWTIKGFEGTTNADDYNEVLSVLGYEFEQSELHELGFESNALDKIKASNVVTEHNIDVLKLLNYTIKHYSQIFPGRNGDGVQQLILKRDALQQAMFNKLFDPVERRFITGRTAEGLESIHTAIDNTSWLVLAIELEKLPPERVEALADSLHYTVRKFTHDFTINGETYFGAHYFLDSFEDPYIAESGLKSDSYHIEATTGLIISLHTFADAFPNHEHSDFFRNTAFRIWKDMQRFVQKHGLLYSSISIKNLFEPLHSTVSAVWFLWAYEQHQQIFGDTNSTILYKK